MATPPVALLAVGGTQQLGVNGAALTGEAITALDSIKYLLSNTSDTVRVRVASTGLVTGLAPSTVAIQLNVFGYKDGVIKADVVLLQVTATALSGLTLSIQPTAPDSAKLAAGTAKPITPILRNPTTGISVAGPVMRYTVRPADITRVAVYQPVLTPPGTNVAAQVSTGQAASMNQIIPYVGQGTAWIYATVNAYGTTLQDSVLYTFSYPYAITIVAGKTNLAVTSLFTGKTVTLAPGATVTFSNGVPATDLLQIAYSFNTPAAATAATPVSTTGGATGNVTALVGTQTSKRQFLVPGTYTWTATASGGPTPWPGQTVSGTITVK